MKLRAVFRHLFHPQQSNNHRPGFLHPKPVLFLSLIALGFYQLVGLLSTFPANDGRIVGFASNITVAQVIEFTNAQRTASGLTPLKHNNKLAQASLAKAQNMFSEGYWAHTSPSGTEPWDFIKSAGYTYKVAGENLARDFDSTAPMIQAWMNSPTHKANIMNPRYGEIGVAVVDGTLHGVETTLVVQMFGSPEVETVERVSGVTVPAVVTQQAEQEQNMGTAPTPVARDATQGTADEMQDAQNSEPDETHNESSAEVLSDTIVPQGSLSNGILFSPQHVLKAFFLSLLLILVVVLAYDSFVAGHKDTIRLVGKNLAHIMLFLAVMYLIIAFKGGVIGS